MSQPAGSQSADHVEETAGRKRSEEPNLPSETSGVAQLPSHFTIANITFDQLRDVDVMLDFAVKRGLEIPPDVLQDIAVAKIQLSHGQGSAELSSRFIAGSAKLARLISPATVKSINFSRGLNLQQKHSPATIARKYNVIGFSVFLVLLSFQLGWFVLNGVVEDIKQTRTLMKPYVNLMEIAWQEMGHNPTGPDVEMWMFSKIGQSKKNLTFVSNGTSTVGSVLAKDANTKNLSDLSSLSISDFVRLKNSLSVDFNLLNLLFYDFAPDADRRIGYFESLGISHANLQNIVKADDVLQITIQFILPVMYGFMGSIVFLVRKISQEINRESLSESSTVDFRLRFFLGGVAGLAIAWFVAPSTEPLLAAASTSARTLANLSPLVMSFVAGYAVELLFSLIDRVVSSFTDSGVKQP